MNQLSSLHNGEIENRSLTRAFQSAWVVDDIERAAMEWVSSAGVGPFFVSEYPAGSLLDTFYRDQATPLTMITALTQVGDMQLELIQPIGDHPNVFRDTVPEGHSAYHHIGLWSRDLERDFERYRRQGFDVVGGGRAVPDGRFGFVDTHIVLGHMTELLEYSEALDDRFQMIAAAARDWDGKDPIRC
jgi:hypothetical protein